MPALAGGVGDREGVREAAPDRLLDPDVLARLDRGERDLAVHGVRGRDRDGIDLRVVEHRAPVLRGALEPDVLGVRAPVRGHVGRGDEPGCEGERGKVVAHAAERGRMDASHPAQPDHAYPDVPVHCLLLDSHVETIAATSGPGTGSSPGATLDEPRGHDDLAARAVVAVEAGEQQLRGRPPERERVLGDHRDAGMDDVGHRDVVEAHERDLVLQALGVDRPHRRPSRSDSDR